MHFKIDLDFERHEGVIHVQKYNKYKKLRGWSILFKIDPNLEINLDHF